MFDEVKQLFGTAVKAVRERIESVERRVEAVETDIGELRSFVEGLKGGDLGGLRAAVDGIAAGPSAARGAGGGIPTSAAPPAERVAGASPNAM